MIGGPGHPRHLGPPANQAPMPPASMPMNPPVSNEMMHQEAMHHEQHRQQQQAVAAAAAAAQAQAAAAAAQATPPAPQPAVKRERKVALLQDPETLQEIKLGDSQTTPQPPKKPQSADNANSDAKSGGGVVTNENIQSGASSQRNSPAIVCIEKLVVLKSH